MLRGSKLLPPRRSRKPRISGRLALDSAKEGLQREIEPVQHSAFALAVDRGKACVFTA